MCLYGEKRKAMVKFICHDCQRVYEPESLAWRCVCGGLLDLSDFSVVFPWARIKERAATLWRYLEALPFAEDATSWRDITMGEGYTPLVVAYPGDAHVQFKVDYMMPTLSFKDRGAAVLIAEAAELGVKRIIADSSGNAGTAIAAYAARAGIHSDIYVPKTTSSKKIKQIALHGATVHTIEGSREDTAAAAVAAVESEGIFYASHIYNPFFFQGTKTYVFELWEQRGGSLPDVLVLPVGNGTFVLGPYYGCLDLLHAGLIQKLPYFVAVQAENCAPLAQAFASGQHDAVPVENRGTVAEGIAIAAPARSRQILAAIRETGGTIMTVSETAIEQAQKMLASRGLFVEPTSAVPYAGFLAACNVSTADNAEAKPLVPGGNRPAQSNLHQALQGEIVIALCGAGLKAV
jgi:threonine synthase